jgi:hypothetical protein
VEVYSGLQPDTCLGCACCIVSGDAVLPVDDRWLVCLDCTGDLLLGSDLKVWPASAEEATAAPCS